MAAFEVIALDTATPQLRAPGASDTYTFPRAVEMPLGTANGVLYLDGSKVVTSGSALTFDGTNLNVSSPIYTGFNLNVGTSASGNPAIGIGQSGDNPFVHLERWDGVVNFDAGRINALNVTGGALGFLLGTGTSRAGQTFSEQMRLTSTGLGIGTSSPGAKLHVKAGTDQNLLVSSSGGIVGLFGTNDAVTAPASVQIQGVDLRFNTGVLAPTERMRLDSSGNLGLGVTPSAWDSGQTVFQSQAASWYGYGTNNMVLSANAYYNASWRYINSTEATRYDQTYGAHQWYISTGVPSAGDPISFTQAMTLDASGNLLVGTTSTSIGGTNYGTLALAGGRLVTTRNVDGTDSVFQAFGNAGALYIQGNRDALNTNNSYGSLSDLKLKENITDATPKLDDLMQVRVVNYNLKNDPGHKQIGVIAQELEQVFPGMVEESPDRDADGNDLGTTTKAVKYSVFVPMLIKAMQEQQAMITSLEARLAAAGI